MNKIDENHSEEKLEYAHLVSSQASFFYKQNELYDKEDLFQVGYIGLLKAIRYHDPKLSPFESYANSLIKNEILRFMGKNIRRYFDSTIKSEAKKKVEGEFDCSKLNGIEKKIVDLILGGLDIKEICHRLNLSRPEYETYFLEISKRLTYVP